jgi:hypothetical protein
MVSPPILRYLFALIEPGNGAFLFRFLACRIARPSPKRTISTTLALKLAAPGRRELGAKKRRPNPVMSESQNVVTPKARAACFFSQLSDILSAMSDGLQILAPRGLQTVFVRAGDPSHIAGLSQGGAHFR